MQSREYQESVKQYKADLAALKEKQAAENTAATTEAKRKQTDADTIVAADKLQNIWKGNRSELEKTADAVEETRKNYETLWKSATGRDMLQSRGVISTDGKNFSGGQWDIDVKALDKSAQGAEQYNKQLQQTLNQKKLSPSWIALKPIFATVPFLMPVKPSRIKPGQRQNRLMLLKRPAKPHRKVPGRQSRRLKKTSVLLNSSRSRPISVLKALRPHALRRLRPAT